MSIGRIAVEVGKALAKAVIAGVGLELAKVASDRVRKHLGPKDKKDDGKPLTPEEELKKTKEEVAELKAELERMKSGHAAHVVTDPDLTSRE